MSVNQRLKLFVDTQVGSQQAFASSINISKQNLNQYLSDDSKGIGMNLVNKIIDEYPQLSLEWLIRGKGDMLLPTTSTPTTPAVIDKAVATQTTSVAKWQAMQVEHNVMVVDNIAEAGSVSTNGDGIRAGIPTYLPKLIPKKEPYIMVAVSGKSMEPDFYDGDYVVCYELTDRREMLADAVHVITSSDGIFLKEVRYINDKSDDINVGFLRLSSRNPRYQPIYLNPEQDAVKLYRVVSVLRSI